MAGGLSAADRRPLLPPLQLLESPLVAKKMKIERRDQLSRDECMVLDMNTLSSCGIIASTLPIFQHPREDVLAKLGQVLTGLKRMRLDESSKLLGDEIKRTIDR